MTAPVVTKPEAIAMTAPVVSNGQFMQFVLPEELKSLEDIPTPANADIQIVQVPGRYVAVTKFNGAYSYDFFTQQYQVLFTKMQQEAFVAAEVSSNSVSWSFAQYNPPFTIPYFRRNEVWIDMLPDYTTDKFKEMLKEAEGSISDSK